MSPRISAHDLRVTPCASKTVRRANILQMLNQVTSLNFRLTTQRAVHKNTLTVTKLVHSHIFKSAFEVTPHAVTFYLINRSQLILWQKHYHLFLLANIAVEFNACTCFADQLSFASVARLSLICRKRADSTLKLIAGDLNKHVRRQSLEQCGHICLSDTFKL